MPTTNEPSAPTHHRLPKQVRDLIESGPLTYLSTTNADGSPQVSAIWIALDGDEIVSGHLAWYAKLRNIERDPRVVLSFDAPRRPGIFLAEHVVLRARATIEPSDQTWGSAQPTGQGLHGTGR